MATDFLLLGVVKTDAGITVITPNQEEHKTTSPEELQAVVEQLFVDEKLEPPETSRVSMSSRRRAKQNRQTQQEIEDFEEGVDKIGERIGEKVTESYGVALGGAVERGITRGAKGFGRFLRQVSRKS